MAEEEKRLQEEKDQYKKDAAESGHPMPRRTAPFIAWSLF